MAVVHIPIEPPPLRMLPTSTFSFSLRNPLMQGNQLGTLKCILSSLHRRCPCVAAPSHGQGQGWPRLAKENTVPGSRMLHFFVVPPEQLFGFGDLRCSDILSKYIYYLNILLLRFTLPDWFSAGVFLFLQFLLLSLPMQQWQWPQE